MKSKGVLILFLLVAFFSVIITSAPAFATATEQQPAFVAEQLPAWLTEAGAVPVSDVALENVQGEFSLGDVAFVAIITMGVITKKVFFWGWSTRILLDKLAERNGWNIRFTAGAAIPAYIVVLLKILPE